MKISLLLLLLTSLLSCHSTNDKNESTKLSHQSKILIEEQKFDEAKIVIDKAIELDPINYVAYNNRAYLGIRQKKSSTEILYDLKRSLDIKPDYEIALYTLTNYYFEIKDYNKSIESGNIYLNYAKKRQFDIKLKQHIYSIIGESKYMNRDFENAITAIETSLQLDSNDAGSHKNLGDCYFYKNNFNPAIKEFDIAISLNNNYYQAYLARARTYEKINNGISLKFAKEDYKTAFRINPKAEDIYETKSVLFNKAKLSNK
jgi:tetratricopeptide (TPR) repeat protein